MIRRLMSPLGTFAAAIAVVLFFGLVAAPRDSAQDFKGEQHAVAAVVERLEAAGRDDKPDVVCTELLSTKLLAAVRAQGTNCKTGVGESFKDADSFDITVRAQAQPSLISPSTLATGTRISLRNTSLNSCARVACTRGRTSTPGLFMSTRMKVIPLCFGASGSVRTSRKPLVQNWAAEFHTFRGKELEGK